MCFLLGPQRSALTGTTPRRGGPPFRPVLATSLAKPRLLPGSPTSCQSSPRLRFPCPRPTLLRRTALKNDSSMENPFRKPGKRGSFQSPNFWLNAWGTAAKVTASFWDIKRNLGITPDFVVRERSGSTPALCGAGHVILQGAGSTLEITDRSARRSRPCPVNGAPLAGPIR
jgi:hypothetical protein